MNRRLLLIAVAVFLVAIFGYKIYISSRLQNQNEANTDKKHPERQTIFKKLSTNLSDTAKAEKTLKVKGLVRDRISQKNLPAARIKVQGTGIELELITDKHGEFEFEMGFDQTVFMTATLKGYCDATVVYHRGKEAVIELLKQGMIAGTITHKGFPVSKAKVILHSWTGEILRETESDSKGEFVLSDVTPTGKKDIGSPARDSFLSLHPYELRVDHPDYCTEWIKEVKLKQGESLNYKIELERCGTIEGNIYDQSSRLVVNVTIRLTAMSTSGSKRGIDVNNGKYNLKLPEGVYYIIADPIGNFIPYESDCLKVVTGQKVTNDIYLKTGLTITGIVTDETSKPLFEVRVSIKSEEGKPIPSSEGSWDRGDLSMESSYYTKEDGKFILQGLSDGLYTIRAHHLHGDYESVELYNIRAGMNDLKIILRKKFKVKRADVDVRMTTLTGKVSDFTEVIFINEDPSAESKMSGSGVSKGKLIEKDFIEEGTYTIIGIDQNQNLYGIIYNRHITKLQQNVISLVLDKKGAQIRGKILNNSDSLKLKLFLDRQKDLQFFISFDTEDDGNFQISGLPPGHVIIESWGEKLREFELQAGEVKDLGTIYLKK